MVSGKWRVTISKACEYYSGKYCNNKYCVRLLPEWKLEKTEVQKNWADVVGTVQGYPKPLVCSLAQRNWTLWPRKVGIYPNHYNCMLTQDLRILPLKRRRKKAKTELKNGIDTKPLLPPSCNEDVVVCLLVTGLARTVWVQVPWTRKCTSFLGECHIDRTNTANHD